MNKQYRPDGSVNYAPPYPEGYEMVPLAKKEIKAAAVQMTTEFVDPDNAASGIQKNLARMLRLIDEAAAQGCDLVVFPEFTLAKGGGPGLFTLGWNRAQWLKAAIMVPGDETQAIGAKARDKSCYVSFSTYIQLPEWPGHFINAAIIIGPSGNVECLHWKAYSGHPGIGTEYATTMYDVWDEFLARHGWKSVWQVARTPLGNLGPFVCSEGHHPEVTRALAFNGAEILCWNISGAGAGFWMNRFPTIFRGNCASNLCWGIYANNGAVGYSPLEVTMAGSSMIVDPCGQTVALAKGSGEEIVTAVIPMAEFRSEQNRYEGHWGNRHLPASVYRGGVRTDLIVPLYEQHQSQFPPNLLTRYQEEHGGQLPPDFRSTRKWYFDHARWQADYHDPAEKMK